MFFQFQKHVSRLFLILIILVGSSTFSCSDGEKGGKKKGEPPPQTKRNIGLKKGDFSLMVAEQPWQLQLKNGEKVLTTLTQAGLALGIVDEFDEDYNYDPFWLYKDGGEGPETLEWLSPKKITRKKSTEQELLFSIDYGKLQATLSIKVNGNGTFSFKFSLNKEDKRVVYTRLSFEVDDKENYYGLGEYFDQVAHRGKVRMMQIEFDPKLESKHNEAHVPVPFFTGTSGWGLFVESYRAAAFDMGATDPQRIHVTVHSRGLAFHLLAAKHPLDVPGLYTRLTGAPALPARWAFGTFLWRNENKDQAEVLADAEAIRKNDLAISALWIDRPYDTVVNNFRFDKKRYPDAKSMIQRLNAQGFRVGVWSTPYLAPKAEEHERFKRNGWFVKMGFRKLNRWSDPVDLTHPDAVAAWQKLIDRIRSFGIEGFKLDYGEDIQLGFTKKRFHYAFHNGENEQTMHHKYALFYHRTYFQKLPKDGGFLICRGGTWGTQKYASIIWPGDLDAGFQKHYQCDKKGGSCHVGGLIASIIGGLSLSQSGFPLYGSDTGGYRHDRPTKEVFMRWGEQTALSTIMQIGGPDPNVNPWDFHRYGPSQFDLEVLETFRHYIRLHTRLFPYNYTYAVAAHRHGRGAMRPYGMAFPDENFHPNDEYMFGDFLLVAPVVQAARSRQIRFPRAYDWIDWEGRQLYKGGKTVDYKAPLNHLPLFIRLGAIVPLLRPDIDTLAPSSEKNIVSIHPSMGPLFVKITLGADASFSLFDGTSIELKNGDSVEISYKNGSEFQEFFLFEVLFVEKPSSILFDGHDLVGRASYSSLEMSEKGWFYDAKKSILFLKVPKGRHVLRLEVALKK